VLVPLTKSWISTRNQLTSNEMSHAFQTMLGTLRRPQAAARIAGDCAV